MLHLNAKWLLHFFLADSCHYINAPRGKIIFALVSLLSLNPSPLCKVGKFKLHALLRFGGNEERQEKGRILS